MNELYDERRVHGMERPADWAQLEIDARKMIESSLELAARVEAS